MKSVSTAIREFFSQNNLDTELQIASLWTNWKEVVGEDLADLAKPLGKRKKTLILAAADGIVMQEISFYQNYILDQIESFLGWQPFDKVKFELLKGKVPLDEVRVEQSYKKVQVPAPDYFGKDFEV